MLLLQSGKLPFLPLHPTVSFGSQLALCSPVEETILYVLLAQTCPLYHEYKHPEARLSHCHSSSASHDMCAVNTHIYVE